MSSALHLLAVGINRYEHHDIHDTRHAEADAQAMLDLFPGAATTRALLGARATKDGVRHAVQEDLARSVEEGDAVIVHCALHGMKIASPGEGSYNMVLYDSRLNEPASMLDLRELWAWLDALRPPALILVLLDCCQLGGLGMGAWPGARHAHPAATHFMTRGAPRGSGRFVIAAATDGQSARPDDVARHGVLTRCTRDVLEQAQAERGTITVARFYDEVAARVHEATGGTQTPVIAGTGALAMIPLRHYAARRMTAAPRQ